MSGVIRAIETRRKYRALFLIAFYGGLWGLRLLSMVGVLPYRPVLWFAILAQGVLLILFVLLTITRRRSWNL